MDGRFGDEHQILAVLGVGDAGVDYVGRGYAGSHEHVQGVDLVEGVKPGMLRGVSNVVGVVQTVQSVVSAG